MSKFDNINRNRYYGLRIGDIVQPYDVNGKPWIEGECEVVEYGFMDNNSVYIKPQGGTETKWVAEWCKVIKKVEENDIYES